MEITGYKDKHEYTNKHGITSVVYLMDCMELLKQIPDKYFELAVVDPPYGIGEDGSKNHSRCKMAISKDYKAYSGNDIEPPSKDYFITLKEKCLNQIVWGANHYISRLPFDSSCWIVWNKLNGKTDFADCELAYTSFPTAVRRFDFRWQGMLQGNMKNKEDRIHPNQKPQALYEWIFKNYAKPNDKILDTHLGSGSSRIAADKANLPFVGCELDPYYFYASIKRFNEYSAQQTLF